MSKIKSLEQLKKIREEVSNGTELRTTGENPNRTIVAVGMGTCGIAAGARESMNALIDLINEKGVKDVSVIAIGCPGYCHAEPLFEIRPPNNAPVVRYANVDKEIAKRIVNEHLIQGKLVDSAIFNKGGN